MTDCIIPSPAEIIKVGAQIIPYRRKELLGLTELMPTTYVDNTQIIINRPDIVRGLQQWRGLASEPPVNDARFNRMGKFCTFYPGYWGETIGINEAEIAMVAEPPTGGTWSAGQPLSIKNEVGRIQNRLTVRMLNRIEKNVWDTLRTGRYIATDMNGNIIFEQFFNIRKARAAVDWNDIVNSAPLATLRSLPELFRDSSATFTGSGVRYYMNRTTLNRLLENRNANDIGKGSLSACCQTVTLEWINGQLEAQGLGRIVVYDNRWVDDQDGVHLFLPDGWVIAKGVRPDSQKVGNYYLTKVMNDGLKMGGDERGFWYFLNDNQGREVTRKVTVGAGHNGGPIIYYPEMVVSLQVF